MQIHTVKEGEDIDRIARSYGTSAVKIIENNGVEHSDRLVTGEQFVILTPTRIHTVRGGETLNEIAARYEVRPRDLVRNNPYLLHDGTVHPGQQIALRYPAPRGGMSAGLGYVSARTTEWELEAALCYLSYFVIDGCRTERGEKAFFSECEFMPRILAQKKTPLLRVRTDGWVPSVECMEHILAEASSQSYHGIVLAEGLLSPLGRRERDGYLVDLRRRMLGCNLILFAEGAPDADFGDYADGNVISPRAIRAASASPDACMDRICAGYECAKTFLGLPTLCIDNSEEISYAKMRDIGHKYKAEIQSGQHFTGNLTYRRFRAGVSEDRTIHVPTPAYIHTLITYLCEYGMMGAAIELCAVPSFVWMLLHTSVYEVDYAFTML